MVDGPKRAATALIVAASIAWPIFDSMSVSAQPCSVEGEVGRLAVVVPLSHGRELPLVLFAAGAVAHVDSSRRVPVELKSSLWFTAEVERADLVVGPRSPGAHLLGRLHLEASANLRIRRVFDRGRRVMLGAYEAVFALECASLQLHRSGLAAFPDWAAPESDGTRWRLIWNTVAVRSSIGRSPFARLSGDVVFDRVRSSGRWVQVVWEEGGLGLTGWVPHTALSETDGGFSGRSAAVPWIYSARWNGGPFVAEAVLLPGTAVYEEPDGLVWARAGRGQFHVRLPPDAEWGQLVHASGVHAPPGELEQYAWVRREDVAFLSSSPSFRR